MSLANQTKTALDESRMLMLGAQILLGFQFHAPFQDAFAALSRLEQTLELIVVALIVLVVGLLITPSARHRIVEHGAASIAINRFITSIMTPTLALFAVALAVDLAIAGALIAGWSIGTAAGLAGFGFAIGLWGAPAAYQRETDVPTSNEKTPLAAKIDYVLTDARVVLPGAQALLGFQLSIVLTEGFRCLPVQVKLIHGAALAFVALSTIVLIAPAAFHRLVYAGGDNPRFQVLAGRMLLVATFCLALGLAAEMYVVVFKIAANRSLATILAILSGSVLLGLWHLWPWVLARARQRASSPRSDASGGGVG
ncbi:DUF6328 family protein [Bosea sp. 2KB_26]